MKRGLLIIDRGSREQETKDELEEICAKVKKKGNYKFTDYCFLEVIPPFIKDGIKNSQKYDLDTLTIIPYFLYPGRKVKAAVTDVMKFQIHTNVKFLISKPMLMHQTMIDLVHNRISSALDDNGLDVSKKDVDVLIIGHGSKDPNAKLSIQYIVDGITPRYRNVNHCFLEVEEPDIQYGINKCEKNKPKILVIVFYFLHKGAHVKRDIYGDLNPALENANVGQVLITKHIGTDEKIIDLIIERAKVVEDAN